MDHKRGYDYLDWDQGSGVASPTKRRKDLSHHRDYPPAAQDYVSQLGDRYNAQIHRSQYKTQIQYGRPQGCCHTAEAAAAPGAEESPACKVWVGGHLYRGSDLEKKMQECAYHSLLPVVKKELERWAFWGNRASKRVLLEDTGSDDSDDETTCAVCRNPRKFKGWDALLIHAQKYSKQMPWQHRGYFRALQEAIVDKKAANQKQSDHPSADHEATTPSADHKPSSGKPCADITHKMDTAQHLKQTVHWRPDILIVENDEFHEVNHILQQQQEEQVHDHQQGDQKPQLREVLAVYDHGDGANEQRHVFVFPASKVGYAGETEISSCRQSGGAKEHDLSRRADETQAAEMEISDSSELLVPCPTGMTSDVARCESLKEALGLQLTLDDPDDRPGRKLFDLEQIHQTSCVVDRWAEHFRSAAKRFETQRVFRDSPQLVGVDEGFRADLRRIKSYFPGCKRKIKEHMSEIESQFRENHLMWLQQVEEVWEQFEELADDMQHQEAREKFLAMRAELDMSKLQ